MMKTWLKIVCLALACVSHAAFGIEALDPATVLRYQQLTRELRCVVCQNQDLAESNTPLAIELRQQITVQLQQQKSNADIKNYLIARYGEFISLKPSFTHKNYLLWLAPFALLIACLSFLIHTIRRRQKNTCQPALSAQENDQLKQLFKP